ncbi:MAG: SMP-30/gluconolactonase/LRE family protein [Planctomycetes bacterium]|nr:SMP-30/gluconolactonase/LRE family protein [Planctomycetota bacterium]
MTTETPPTSLPPPARWSTRRVLAILVPLFLLHAFPIGFWPRQIGANASAQAYLAMALYFRGEVCVDEEVRDYVYNHDLIYRDGHYYSNKPPGPALWLVPAAALIDLLSVGRLELVALMYFGRVLMLTLPFVVFLYFLGRELERLASPAVAWGLTLAYALGTNAGVYATLYLSHGLAAMGLATGFLILRRGRAAWCWLGGLATSFAVLCELQTVVIAVVLAVLSFLAGGRGFNWKAGLSFVLPPFLMAGILFLYLYLVSGVWTELPYQTEFRQFNLPTAQTLGFHWPPDLSKLVMLAFSPALGLFFHSPWLLLVIPAAVAAVHHRAPARRWLVGALVAALALPVLFTVHSYWVGGAIAGPRYLTASLPFFLFPIAAFLHRLREPSRTVAAVSLVATAVVAIVVFAAMMLVWFHVNTEPDKLDLNPLTSFVFPLASHGVVNLTVALVLGAGPAVSVGIHLALLLAALAGFVVPWVREARAPARAAAVLAVFLGGVLFLIWTLLGRSEDSHAKFHVNRSLLVMRMEYQPRLYGRIRFPHRLEVFPPRPVRADVSPYDPAAAEILPDPLLAEELGHDFKSLFAVAVCPDGDVLLSDIGNNTIYRYVPDGQISVVTHDAGAEGAGVVHLFAPGVSGIAVDREGRAIVTEHGRRRVSRLEPGRPPVVLAERYEGRRLNSPRGPVVRSDGTLFFADPPFGLNQGHRAPERELDFSGVYRWRDGELTLLTREMDGPSALALSADEKQLYVTDWRPGCLLVVRYDLDEEGNLSKRIVLSRFEERDGLIPTGGFVLDREGRLYLTANLCLWILSPEGKALAMVWLTSPIHAMAWGGEDARTLYLAAHTGFYRLRTEIPGVRR